MSANPDRVCFRNLPGPLPGHNISRDFPLFSRSFHFTALGAPVFIPDKYFTAAQTAPTGGDIRLFIAENAMVPETDRLTAVIFTIDNNRYHRNPPNKYLNMYT